MHSDTPLFSFCLPSDLITEILIKLPIKTLLQFKTVCISWNDLISDPYFQSMRHRKVLVSKFTYHSTGIIPTLVNYSDRSSLVLHTDPWPLRPDSRLPDELMCIFNKRSDDWLKIIGPHHGVYLVQDEYGNAALWNHATKEFKILSKDNYSEFVTYGFGSEVNVDGRVDFVAMRLYEEGSDMNEKAPALYRLSTGVWKELKPLPKEYHSNQIAYSTVTIDGVFYWIDRGNNIRFLIAFDTRTESFEKMDLPNFVRDETINGNGITTSLRLSCYTCNGTKTLSLVAKRSGMIEIWVLKPTWTKKGTVFFDPLKVAANADTETWDNICYQEESLFGFV